MLTRQIKHCLRKHANATPSKRRNIFFEPRPPFFYHCSLIARMKNLATLVLLVLVGYWSKVEAQYLPAIERYTLPNGLTVILNYDETQHGVFGAVAVKAGSKNDPSDATGLAHYQEHMLFKGTTELGTVNWEAEKVYIDSIFIMYDELGKTSDEEQRNVIQKKINRLSVKANEYAVPNEFSNLIKSIGGTGLNAFTMPDMTVYHNAFPANQMEKWLELYSHRFMEPVFRGFQSELEVVYEEYNMNADAFGMKLFQEFQKNLFKNHPYGTQSTIGTIEHLKNPSLTKMYAFFEDYYVANNMVLVLSGNFDVSSTKQFIAEKFGRLKSGTVPEFEVPAQTTFNGRELVEVRMSPIKIGGMGFATVPQGHPDELKIKVINNLLNNAQASGLLDELSNENKLLAAQVVQMPYIDYGANILIFVPKIIGQKLENAEALVNEQLEKLRNGKFADWKLESAKNELYIEEQRKLESKEQLALELINAELMGLDLTSVFNTSEQIRDITKEEIMATAKKYFNSDYLCFYSKQTLKSSKEKIAKPNFKPVIPKKDTSSLYVQEFNKIESGRPIINFIDFNRDVFYEKFGSGHDFYGTENPKNNIFTLRIDYHVGYQTLPLLKYVTNAMSVAGAGNMSGSKLHDTLNYYNCNVQFFAGSDYLRVYVEGLEENLDKVLPIINEMLSHPVLTERNMKTVIQGEKTTRRFEKSEADVLADALYEYMRYGDKSNYLNRLTMHELKKLEPTAITETIIKATQYVATVHYVGKRQAIEAKDLLGTQLPFADKPLMISPEDYRKAIQYDDNTVFFVNKKSARQSKIFLTQNDMDYQPDKQAQINAFNLYFGGDFSGLVLQEIREYRSLAYSSGARIQLPNHLGRPCSFEGYIGTQADKTNEALEVYYKLMREMPSKKERMQMIRDYLTNKLQNDQPGFRYLSGTIAYWKNMGFNSDPRRDLLERYSNMKFSDIYNFYSDEVQKNIIAMAIAGDSRAIDMAALEQFGTLKELKKKHIISK
ncbi:hypothetical protein GC194_07025 [bacterium]|nr:hypothetical protein [bacterium]